MGANRSFLQYDLGDLFLPLLRDREMNEKLGRGEGDKRERLGAGGHSNPVASERCVIGDRCARKRKSMISHCGDKDACRRKPIGERREEGERERIWGG